MGLSGKLEECALDCCLSFLGSEEEISDSAFSNGMYK